MFIEAVEMSTLYQRADPEIPEILTSTPRYNVVYNYFLTVGNPSLF